MLLTNFESIYKRIFNSIDNPTLKTKDLKKFIDSDCSFTYSPSFYIVENMTKLSIDYISKNMQACLGLNENELLSKGISEIWSRIHPKDLLCLSNTLDEVLEYIENGAPHLDDEQFSYSFNYRFQKNDTSYINIIQNITPFCVNTNCQKKALTYFTVILSRHAIPIQASIHSLSNNQVLETKHITNCSQRTFFKSISKREKIIIDLLAKKNSSKSISKKLFISPNTVDTHRRNILKKLKLKSTGELINIIKTQQHLI